jgi:hypothetical protein
MTFSFLILCFLLVETIRKFLEANNREVVILCLEPHECSIYEVLAPIYFPRNQLEESSASWQLPKNSPEITDNTIRITRNPQHNIMIRGECRENFISIWRHFSHIFFLETPQ